MIYELRHYVPVPGKEEALRDRFRNSTLALFAKLGMRVVDFWETTDFSGELWYVMEWPDEASMRAAWDAFRQNEEWIATKVASEAQGPLTRAISSRPLRRCSFFARGT